MSRKKEIIHQSGIYTFSTFLTQLITLIAAFLTRKFLGPVQMGIWATLQILVDYSKYTVLGTMSAVGVEIPYWMGKGDLDHAEKIKNTAFTFVMISTLLFCAAVAAFAFFTEGRFPAEVTFGLYFVAAIIFLQRINNLLIALLRCYKKFHIESGQMVLSAIVNALLIAFLASKFKIYGFISALGLSFVFNIIYLFWKHRYHFRWYFDRKIFQPLLVRGFPLMLIGLLNTALQNIDRMVIAKMLSFELLGMYTIALMACSFISNFFSATSTVMVPHFQEKIGETDDPKNMREFMYKASLPLALVMPILIACAWIFVPYAIKLFLPKFIPGIPAMRLLVLGTFFSALIQPYQNFLVTVKKHMRIFPIVGVAIVSAVGLSWLAVHFQYGINGVAVAISVTAFLNFMLSYFVSARIFATIRDALRRFLILMVFFAYLGVFLFLESFFVESFSYGFIRFIAESLSLIIFCGPLLFVLESRFAFFRNLWKKLSTPKA